MGRNLHDLLQLQGADGARYSLISAVPCAHAYSPVDLARISGFSSSDEVLGVGNLLIA